MSADEFYARLLALFAGREPRDALRIAAKLTLALAAEVGDEAAVQRAVSAAEEKAPPPPDFESMTHYGYFRSSSDYRLRIALNLKRVKTIPRKHIHLRDGEQNGADYRRGNSAGLVPALEFSGGVLPQSLAIIEYLNVLAPQPDLLPGDALQQAKIRAFALAVACDIQPLGNLRVLNELRARGADEAAVKAWLHNWMAGGFAHLEERAREWRRDGKYLFGAQPTLAEVCLIPQMYNARRFETDLSPYPLLREIEEVCMSHRAFRDAAPENQPESKDG